MTRFDVKTAVGALSNATVLVVGDLMLDEYLWGKTERVSPEAPVPIVDVAREELRLGGAGNVVNNLATLGCQVKVISVLGDDADGEQIKMLLAAKGIDLSGVLVDEGRVTSRKTRIVATGQQMIRVDRESRQDVCGAIAEAMLNRYAALLDNGVQAVILSDYGKGSLPDELLRQFIDLARSRKIPALADPKGYDYSRYSGAAVITPNRKEASEASGRVLDSEDAIVALGTEMRRDLSLDALLITRSEEGMSLFREEGVTHLQAQAREVYDVSGAGDTVIAVFGAALGAGLGFNAAAEMANLAAGVVVGKIGTSTVTCTEILTAANEPPSEADRKIRNRNELGEILEKQRQAGRKIVFTNGCFDLLHVGHVKYLQAARRLGDLLVLGLNSDASIKRLKGESRPLINQEERSHVLAALGCIDYVVVFDEDTPLQLLEVLRPDVLVKGGDYTPETVVGRELVESYGGRVELITFVDGKSTTGIIDRILAQCREDRS